MVVGCQSSGTAGQRSCGHTQRLPREASACLRCVIVGAVYLKTSVVLVQALLV
jgi:hypothetical protein